jgi:hypothetical protein
LEIRIKKRKKSREIVVSLQRQFKTTKKMEARTTTFKPRTPEEVRVWFLAAKARKEAKTKDVKFQWDERRRILDTLIGLETK